MELTRQQLYEMVWAEPVTRAKFVSSGQSVRCGIANQKRTRTSAPCRFLSSSGNTRIAAVWRGDA